MRRFLLTFGDTRRLPFDTTDSACDAQSPLGSVVRLRADPVAVVSFHPGVKDPWYKANVRVSATV